MQDDNFSDSDCIHITRVLCAIVGNEGTVKAELMLEICAPYFTTAFTFHPFINSIVLLLVGANSN